MHEDKYNNDVHNNILKEKRHLAQLYQIVNNPELWNTDQSSLMLHIDDDVFGIVVVLDVDIVVKATLKAQFQFQLGTLAELSYAL